MLRAIKSPIAFGSGECTIPVGSVKRIEIGKGRPNYGIYSYCHCGKNDGNFT
jgi:hypothetical protein